MDIGHPEEVTEVGAPVEVPDGIPTETPAESPAVEPTAPAPQREPVPA